LIGFLFYDEEYIPDSNQWVKTLNPQGRGSGLIINGLSLPKDCYLHKTIRPAKVKMRLSNLETRRRLDLLARQANASASARETMWQHLGIFRSVDGGKPIGA
jgi:hypothetical protein